MREAFMPICLSACNTKPLLGLKRGSSCNRAVYTADAFVQGTALLPHAEIGSYGQQLTTQLQQAAEEDTE
jgi:hypothetical protein